MIEDIILMEKTHGGVIVPGTRFSLDLLKDAPGAFTTYVPLLERTVLNTKDLVEDALASFIQGFTTRLHAGQTPHGTISSAIPSSTLRLPEMNSGSLVALSI